MGKCEYCHNNWDKRKPLRETSKEYVILGITNKIEIEVKESNNTGLTVFTSIETETCPICSRWLKSEDTLDGVKELWGNLYLREDIEEYINKNY